MRRTTVIVAVAGVVLIVAAAAFLVMTRLDRAVADILEAYGRETTGTEVRVSSVDVSLRNRRGTVRGLTVGNPPGYETAYALELEQIELDVDLTSLTGDVLVVNRVDVNGGHLNAEQRGEGLNLATIQRNMARAAAAAAPREQEPLVIIDRFRLTNGRVTLVSELLGEETTLELRDVVVESVGRAAGGVTYEEATQALLDPVIAEARRAARGRLGDAARRELEEEVRERLRDLLER